MPTRRILKYTTAFVLTLCLTFSSFALSSANVNAASASSSAGTVAVSSGRLNVRSSASTSGSILTKLSNGSYITLISRSGAWWKVEYASGKYGYCSASYIRQLTSSKAMKVTTSGSSLNVRTGPSTSYSVKSSLRNGTAVVVISDHGTFSRVLYNGTSTGYVSKNYLKAFTSSDPSVKLSVPSYKQTDSRWASVKLGSSGKTIGDIGCTTTALAMVESYRTSTTITPDAMSKKLTYSSSGSLYWPSNYRFVTDSKNYLSTVADLLRQGKPVIIGCKKSSGSQHWVVVTGWNGQSLSASAFTINDPGSKSRTTLSQFISVYPNFHKIAYYA